MLITCNCEGVLMRIYEAGGISRRPLSELADVWEKSVSATHLFLSQNEVKRIKKYAVAALRDVEHLVVVKRFFVKPVAFMGVQSGRLEMLFVSPPEMGKGLGKRLLRYGICKYGVREVTVNEQNLRAVGFYSHMGFKTYKRTDCDENVKTYPYLH